LNCAWGVSKLLVVFTRRHGPEDEAVRRIRIDAGQRFSREALCMPGLTAIIAHGRRGGG